jgi:hypothetical protein
MKTGYSALKYSGVISHPLAGQSTFSGSGMIKVNVSYLDNLTESELGMFGDPMVSKIESRRANITMEMQQTSALNSWLIAYANTVQAADAASWSGATITLTETYDNGITTTANDCAIVKRPDRSNQAQGDRVTWEFLSANCVEE